MVIFEGRKERNVLFNDRFQMFYLLSHGVGHMGKGPFIYRDSKSAAATTWVTLSD